jgi:hypothetical protein
VNVPIAMADPELQPHETLFGRDRAGRFNADILAHQLRVIGEDYADKERAYELLNCAIKPLLAKLTLDARAYDPTLKSRREAQDVAEASDDYAQHLVLVTEAAHAKNNAKARYDAVRTFARTIWTQESNNRTERRGY